MAPAVAPHRKFCYMASVKSYRDLIAWQVAMDLAALCYQATDVLPDRERYGLTAQIRRAASSVPANVAEGHCHSIPGYRHHVTIAMGSLAELETPLDLAHRLSYLSDERQRQLSQGLTRVGQLLNALARSLTRTLQSPGRSGSRTPDPGSRSRS